MTIDTDNETRISVSLLSLQTGAVGLMVATTKSSPGLTSECHWQVSISNSAYSVTMQYVKASCESDTLPWRQ